MNLKEEIINNSGLNESNSKRREWKKLAKEYNTNTATAIQKGNEKSEKVEVINNPIKYATSNKDFLAAVRKFYKKPEMKPSDIKEKFFYYDKKEKSVSPGSWDS